MQDLFFDKPHVHIHVDALEVLAEVNGAEFQPLPNATPAQPALPVIGDGGINSRLVERKAPGTLPIYMADGVDGRIVLSIIVGKDGRVISIRPISGFKSLQALLSKAVAQ